MSVEYLEHTADVGVRARGETVKAAFCEAARGVVSLMVSCPDVKTVFSTPIHVRAETLAGLLVEYLSELLAARDLHGLAFGSFDARIERDGGGYVLRGTASGERFDPGRHKPGTEVKGISYLGLDVRQEKDGSWVAECVVDV